MTRTMLGRTAFAVVVAVALGFGAREAAAAPGTAREARPSCTDQQDCQNTCEEMYPDRNVMGLCDLHTCWCYY
jgi:hypothetical protein